VIVGKMIKYTVCHDCAIAACNDDYSGMDDNQAMRTRAGLKRTGHITTVPGGMPDEQFECDVCGSRKWSEPKHYFQGVNYAEKSWKHTSHGSGSDDGLWMRRIDANTVAVVEFRYWADMDSSAIETHGQYNVMSGTVELDNERLASALQYVGLVLKSDGSVADTQNHFEIRPTDFDYAYAVAQALWSYGERSIGHDESGNNRRKLMRCGKSFAA
jgi:hypothetical protein